METEPGAVSSTPVGVGAGFAPNDLGSDTVSDVAAVSAASVPRNCEFSPLPLESPSASIRFRIRRKTFDVWWPGHWDGQLGSEASASGHGLDSSIVVASSAAASGGVAQPAQGSGPPQGSRVLRIQSKMTASPSQEWGTGHRASEPSEIRTNEASSSAGPRGRRTLTVSPWLSGFSRMLHHSHSFGHKQGILWCWRCGRFSITKVDMLGKICPGGVRPYGLACLKRIRRGKTPRYDIRWPRGAGDADECPPDVAIISRAFAPVINVLPELRTLPSAVAGSGASCTDCG